MKQLILVLTCCFTAFAGFAQCDKNVVITSSKTEYLDADTVLQRTIEENTIIQINKPDMIISPGEKRMTAKITADTCNWTTPYVEGQSVLKVTFTDEQGDKKDATVTISAENGKLTFLVRIDGAPFMIRVPIDKFEESK